MSPQMAWPTEIKEAETEDYDRYRKTYETKGEAGSFQESEGYPEKSRTHDSLPPSDNLALNFKHDLHRGLKSRQIAMVSLLTVYNDTNNNRSQLEARSVQV